MSEPEIPQESSPVSDSWQQMVQTVLAVVLLAGAVAMFHYYAPVTAQSAQPDELHRQVQQLTQQFAQPEQEQALPPLVRSRHRDFLCFIYRGDQVRIPHQ